MLNMYVNDHDGKYPQFYSLSNPFSWSDYLMPYTINVKTTADDGSNDKGRRRDPTSIYNCPSVAYDANSQLAPYGKDYASTLGYTFAVSAARWRYVRGRVPAASETILVGDMEATDDDRIASYDGYRLDTSASAPFSETFTSYADGLVAPRHEKLANMGFVDGHSEAMEPTNLLYTSSKWIWYTP
jgi:prepilin-type processing-associated H-X9-DG protein